jgi:hypothetical protein
MQIRYVYLLNVDNMHMFLNVLNHILVFHEMHIFVFQTSLAATWFAAVEKKPFHFLHCWSILKDQPKWMDQHMGYQNPPPNPIGTQSNTIDLDAAEDSGPSSFTSKRPLGRDSAKEKAKKQRSENTSSTDSEYLT